MVQRCEFPIVSKRDIAYFLVGECLSGELTRSVHLKISLPLFRIGLLNFRVCNLILSSWWVLGFSRLPGLIRKLKWCFPETMSTGSRKPCPKNGEFLGDEELWELGEVMWWKASETKKEKSSGQKKTHLAGVHLLVYRGWICRHSDCGGWKKNGRLVGTCGHVRLLLVKTG